MKQNTQYKEKNGLNYKNRSVSEYNISQASTLAFLKNVMRLYTARQYHTIQENV